MNYMTEHLREAIEMNTERMPKYAKLSQGKSKKISRLMILSERASLVTSLSLDLAAKYWTKKGVPLMVHEFIPMNMTPDFSEKYDFEFEKLEKLPELDCGAMEKKFKLNLKNKNYQQLFESVDQEIKKLEKYPAYFCMVRHLLESLRRSAHLTTLHLQKAKELQVTSPETICRILLSAHLMGLRGSLFMDKLAHPIQNMGIPIIHNDVPPIPAYPESY